MHAIQWCWRPSAIYSESLGGKSSKELLVALLSLAATGFGLRGTARNGLAASWSGLPEANKSKHQIYLVDISFVYLNMDVVYFCLLYVLFRSWTEAWAQEIPMETSNCLGLCDVHLEQLALLGLITLMEVYPVVLWLFFITFKIKKWFPVNVSINYLRPFFVENEMQ